MNRRLTELVIQAMDSRAFEDLVFSLVRAEEPTARQLKPPDAGRDTVVPATDLDRERAWQAKHHASGINWTKCEESLKKAIEKRAPEEVTFVFPVNLTEKKEGGLTNLRKAYPAVELPEPWTIAVLLDKLADAPDIRRQHIDSAIPMDHGFAREMLERGAGLKEGWDERLSAALQGPLAVLGRQDEVDEAQALAEDGDLPAASRRFEEIAMTIADRMPAVADGLSMRAARAAAEADLRMRAGELYLRVSRTASGRGDDLAEYAAFRASWNLPEDQRWRSAAATARAVWQEHPKEAIPVLRAAFDQVLDDDDADGVLEWSTALCEVLAAEDDWRALEEIGKLAGPVLGPVERLGPRLDLELDLLAARSESGQDVDHDWSELLLSPVGRGDEGGALIRARWGMAAARRGRLDVANAKFREAAASWRLVGDAEEEIAEAILSEDVLAQLLGGRTLDQAARIAVSELRGRTLSPTILADRKETEGLRAWLADRGWDARRNLLLSWSIHRRAGHLAGCLRLAEALYRLFEGAGERAEALTWAIRCGRQNTAKEMARGLGWPEVWGRLRPHAPPWEQGAAFEAVAVAGSSATDDEIRDMVPPLLAVARNHTDKEHLTLQPGPAARRALATLLCRIPEEHFAAALQEVIHETETTPYPPACCVNGLLLATGASLCDEGRLIVEVFSAYGYAHLPGYAAVLELIGRLESARESAVALAGDSRDALLLCAWADVPDDVAEIAERAALVVARSLAEDAGPGDALGRQDRGCLARWADPKDQDRVADDLVEVLASPSEIGVHRYEAAKGLLALAPGLCAGAAGALLDRMVGLREAVATQSTEEGMTSHPNPAFARVRMSMPAEGPEVVAMALRADVALAARSSRLSELRTTVEDALGAEEMVIRAAALDCAIDHRDLADVDLRRLVDDDDPTIRALALNGLAGRDELEDEDPALVASSGADEHLGLRSTAVRIAREDVDRQRSILELLAGDPNVFVRAAARVALREG